MKHTTKEPAYDLASQLVKQQKYSERFHKFLIAGNPEAWVTKPPLKEEKERGFDFIVSYGPGNDGNYTVELKTDFRTHETGNLVFEVISEAYGGWGSTMGNGFKMEADWIAHVAAGPDKIRIYDPDDLRAYAIEHWGHLRPARARNVNVVTGVYMYCTLMVLLPVAEIKHLLHADGNLREPAQLMTYISFTDTYRTWKGDRHGIARTRRHRRIKNRDWANFQRPNV